MAPSTSPPAPVNEHYPHLFAPFALAGRPLKNRIVHASISLHFGAENGVPQGLLDYHGARAAGGAAMIVTEPIGIAQHQGTQRIAAWHEKAHDGLSRWAQAVERHDCRLIGQIQDSGRGRHVPGRVFSAMAPSALPDDLSGSVPRALQVGEIERFIEDAAQACRRMQRAGFSGAEVSAGHGHLFHQFLSPWSNLRDDRYGGDLAGRTSFLIELCQAVRAMCGAGFILGVKLPGDDGMAGSIGPTEAAAIAVHLTSSVKVDYLAYAQGSHSHTLEMHLPDGAYARMPYLALTRKLGMATPAVPVMALGRITDPAEAQSILSRGDIDLIGLGRPLITDAAWPAKARAGRARNIRYCVSCNTCWKVIVTHTPIACDNNPAAGKPHELEGPAFATRARHVVVVGAGVAGLEAAMTAARRGHRVTVLGASAEVGGKTRLYAAMPIAESMSSVYDYQYVQALRAGAKFRLGRSATLADIMALKPDEVILATGASMTWPMCLPKSLQDQAVVPDLRQAMQALLTVRSAQPGKAVVLDLDQTDGTYAAIERLRDLFNRVLVLCPRERIAEETSLVTRQRVRRRFQQRGVEVICLVEPVWTSAFEDLATLHYRGIHGGPLQAIEDVALFTYATPRVPDQSLLTDLRSAGLEVTLVGDCKVARGVLEATAEGYAAGIAV